MTLHLQRCLVRPGSRPAGQFEERRWRRFTTTEASQLVIAADRFEISTKVGNVGNGVLGHIAISVLRLLASLAKKSRGRIDPSVAWIARKIGRSQRSVFRALNALEEHRFLTRLRRYRPAASAGGAGPQVAQTSNAYFLALPDHASAFAQPVPAHLVSDDLEQLHKQQLADRLRMMADENGLAAAFDKFPRNLFDHRT